MKRVLIIRNAFKHDFGGAEMYALNLAIALRKNNYEPIVVSRVPILLKRCEEHKIKHIKGLWYSRQGWGRFYKLFGFVITLWYLLVLISRRIYIVHAQSRDDFIFATMAARILGKKVIWTDHADLKYIMEKQNSPNLRKRIIQLAKYTTKVIVVSNSEKKEIISRYPKFPNIVVIHNGVFIPSAISPIKKPKKLVIGSTSRLVRSKGIAELIEGYSKIQNIENTELWLVGDGKEKQIFEKLVNELDIAEHVKFLGYKKDVWSYLKAFDIYIQPTYHEAFSISLVEAGITGCAVIATDVGGNPEIINNSNGILITAKSPDAITKQINRLITKPGLRNNLSKNLQEKAKSEFNFDTIVKTKVIPIYESN